MVSGFHGYLVSGLTLNFGTLKPCNLETLKDNQNVVLAHDEVILALEVDFLAGIFAVEDDVAHIDGHEVAVFAGAYGDDFAALWFFFGSVGNDDAAFGLIFSGRRLDDDTVCDWFHTF